jgi:hypothetical protein
MATGMSTKISPFGNCWLVLARRDCRGNEVSHQMNRTLRVAPRRGAAYLAILTFTISALTASDAVAAPSSMTRGQLQDQFVQCGFEIPNSRAPTTNPYVVIRDPGWNMADNSRGRDDSRVVMAIVYADAFAASLAHTKAHRQAEQRIGESWAFSDDFGPQLLAGYGASVWRRNVVLVQSTARTLASMYAYDSQTDEARIARPELLELGFAPISGQYGVDRDLVACLEYGDFADSPMPPVLAPSNLPGNPQ